MRIFPFSLLLIFASLPAIATPSCDEVLQNTEMVANIASLARLKLSLEQTKVNGNTSINQTALKYDYNNKENELVQYVEQNQIMTEVQLKERMRQKILLLQVHLDEKDTQKKIEREQQKIVMEEEARKRVVDGKRAIFRPVKGGSFKMGEEQVDVLLEKDFALMATPTTQVIWKVIAERINAQFPGKYKLNPNPSKFKGDTLPVESISVFEIQSWISGLNELSLAGDPLLEEIFPQHKKGDVYRLPTEAEWEFTLRCRGTCNQRFFFGDDASELIDYAWTVKDSNSQTQPVALKKPLIVDDLEFFDMLGNVFEVMQDMYKPVKGGTDPQGHNNQEVHKAHVIRGGAFSNDSEMMQSLWRGSFAGKSAFDTVGFRLVRERP